MAGSRQTLTSPNTTQHLTQQVTRQALSAPPNSVTDAPNSLDPPHVVPHVASRGEKAEGIIQTIIMLTIGVAAGAASFRHVHDVAAAHGQTGWLAWFDAVTLELASIAAGLDLRRRKRAGKPVGFPAVVLACAVVLSLAAQVVQAEPSVIGWIAAALPALMFLAMVKMALGRADAIPDPAKPGTVAQHPGQAQDDAGATRTDQNRPRSSVDLSTLLPAAREAAHTLTAQGAALNRASLAGQLRKDGHALSTATATELVRLLRNDKQHDRPADPPAAEPVTVTDR